MREELRLPSGWNGAAWEGRAFINGHGPQPRHHHDEWEANLIVAGRASYLLAHGAVELCAGDLIWLPPRMDHILLRTTKDYRSWVVVWRLPHDPPWIVQFYSAKPSACVRRISPRWRRALVGACALLATGRPDEALQPGPATGDLRAVREGFAWLLTVHRAAWEGPAEPRLEAMRPLHPAVAQAVRLLRDGQGRPTLPELAARTGLSPGRLGRLFRVECGSGVVEWRNRLRLDRWLELTAAGAGAFDAAMDAGFGSYAQFHRVHRARFGRGPRSVAKG